MFAKSLLKRLIGYIPFALLFAAVLTAMLLISQQNVSTVYYAASGLLLTASLKKDELGSVLFGIFCGITVFLLSLLFGVLIPFPHGSGNTLSALGHSYSLTLSLVPPVLACLVTSLITRFLSFFKGISSIIVTTLSGLIGAVVLPSVCYGISLLFYLPSVSESRAQSFVIALTQKSLLLVCVTFMLGLAVGIYKETKKHHSLHKIDISFEDEVPDLEPGEELLPFRRMPMEELMSENYFDYQDFVYTPKDKKPYSDVRLVIFDMDGLIVNSEELCYTAFKRTLNHFGADIELSEYLTLTGGNMKAYEALMTRVLPAEHREEFEKTRLEDFRQLYTNDPNLVKPGFFRLMEHLKDLGIMTAIGTSSLHPRAEGLLEAAGNIAPLFDIIVCGDDAERKKPFPDIYLEVLRRANVNAGDALVLEDSRAGIQSANEAGIPVIMVPDMTPPTPDITQSCVAVCTTLYEVINLI